LSTAPSAEGTVAFLVTCEHGGNDVPDAWRDLFRGAAPELASHRGWDAGALELARRLAVDLGAPLQASTTTRLLVDLNRSAHNPSVFSRFSRGLSPEGRTDLLRGVWEPYRRTVDARVSALTATGRPVIHVGVHSFTPVLDGVRRRADVALLYDPARPAERAFAAVWLETVRRIRPTLRVRRNHPYRGASDGLTTWLRRRHGAGSYLGLELEVSQGLLGGDGRFPRWVSGDLVSALRAGSRSLGRREAAGGNRPA
jgi:predicted N-formylglutamate amidohydrolase